MSRRTIYRIPGTAYQILDDGRFLYLVYGAEDTVAIYERMATLVEIEAAIREDMDRRFARATTLHRVVGV